MVETPHGVGFSFLCPECNTVSRRSYNRDPSFWKLGFCCCAVTSKRACFDQLLALQPGIDTARHIQEEATDALPSAKKKKRLRKAGDMERGSQSEESDKAAPTRLKQSLQVLTVSVCPAFRPTCLRE